MDQIARTSDCYGGIVFDDAHRVLVRKPAGHWGGYAWTFAKGAPEAGETPEAAALREVLEETGCRCEIIAAIPGAFESETCWTSYFLMRLVEQLNSFDHETQEVRWVTVDQATVLLSESTTIKGRIRDLAALAAGAELRRRIHNAPAPMTDNSNVPGSGTPTI
jgi:8-oxo-dGTP pyrophosphatase MutT (NUDIX family)